MGAIPIADVLLRLALAVVLGGAVGLEREIRHKPAGLRTNILIALGSALFSMLSLEIGTRAGSPDRIAAQIVTGIGFLGAGAILRSGDNVHGLTTAATIWMNAAIGMAAGVGAYAAAIASAVLTLIVLAFLPVMERLFERRGRARPATSPTIGDADAPPGPPRNDPTRARDRRTPPRSGE